MTLLFDGHEWTFDLIRKVTEAMAPIAYDEIGLRTYRNQIEVVSSEQMLDMYASHAMPQMYDHWRFGKAFTMHRNNYVSRGGGLAYEVVINSDPCITYVMEENSMLMQTLVIAHASYGHNHFFRNNCNFVQWTDAAGILDYMAYAKRFIRDMETRHGVAEVERILDAAHALENHGVDRYKRRRGRPADDDAKDLARKDHEERTFDQIWSTLPPSARALVPKEDRDLAESKARRRMRLPEENLLYFIEKNAPGLKDWQREIVRIVRHVSQYFYPQKQLKVNNEGCATWTHYEILGKLHERGQISDGAWIEAMMSHTSVVFQPEFDSPYYQRTGWNPYALGFAIMKDIQRMSLDPTPEDRDWFPRIAGNGDPYGNLRTAWAEERDDGLIGQYLSPKVMRDFRMFHLHDKEGSSEYLVASIHDESGYRKVRNRLASSFDVSRGEPNVNVVDANLYGDRKVVLEHSVVDGRLLDVKATTDVLSSMRILWGYGVTMLERDAATGKELASHSVE